MPHDQGQILPLSPPRRFMADLMHFAHQVPGVPSQREMNLAPLVAARRAAYPRPSWESLFAKAYGRVAARRPELRRSFVPFPWPHFYEHPHSVASIAVEREWAGEPGVLFGHLRAPENQDLRKVDAALRRMGKAPLDEIGRFRRILRLSSLPWPLGRLAWWAILHLSGYRRARQFGTYGIVTFSQLGSESLHPLSPLATTLSFGVMGNQGEVTVRLVYDHRVVDGATVARTLVELEAELRGPILDELTQLEALGGPWAAPADEVEILPTIHAVLPTTLSHVEAIP